MTEHLPRRRVHHPSAELHRAQRLQEREVATSIDFEVENRINHGVDVTDLTGEVEDDLGLARGVGHCVAVADVGNYDFDVVVGSKVLAPPPMTRDKRVDD